MNPYLRKPGINDLITSLNILHANAVKFLETSNGTLMSEPELDKRFQRMISMAKNTKPGVPPEALPTGDNTREYNLGTIAVCEHAVSLLQKLHRLERPQFESMIIGSLEDAGITDNVARPLARLMLNQFDAQLSRQIPIIEP